MAMAATVHSLSIQLADVDRAVYQDLELRVARHPSETAAFLLARVLAYCLEYREGIALTGGVAAVDEPAVLVRDLTGRILSWIEVGAPAAERLHRGSKLAERAAVYTHKDMQAVRSQLDGRKVHRAAEIPLFAFARGFADQAGTALQRRSKLAVSVTGRELYLDVDGRSFSSTIHEERLG